VVDKEDGKYTADVDEVKSEISIKSPDQLQLFLDQEEQMLHDIVERRRG
jgi:chaperonin GroEL (HSP60 family)